MLSSRLTPAVVVCAAVVGYTPAVADIVRPGCYIDGRVINVERDFMGLRYFSLDDFRCKCCEKNRINPLLVQALDDLRHKFGYPLVINSGYRCVAHNRVVGGSTNSLHTVGLAADISTTDLSAKQKWELLKLIFESKFNAPCDVGMVEKHHFGGIGVYSNFIHIDIRDYESLWTTP